MPTTMKLSEAVTKEELRELRKKSNLRAFGTVAWNWGLIVAAFAGAELLALATGLPLTTAFLALAPAAVTEMVITAKAMHLDAEIVTAFHVMRIFLVCSTVLAAFRLYNLLRGLARPRAQ